MFDLREVFCPSDAIGTRSEAELRGLQHQYENKHQAAKQCNPASIIEIGVRAGYSALAFLLACPKALFYGFDKNGGTHGGGFGLGYHYWAEILLAPYPTRLWPDFDTQAVDRLPVQAQFVHVDGEHTLRGTVHDMDLAVVAGARWILVDDIKHIGAVGEAVELWLAEHADIVVRTQVFEDIRGQMLIMLKGAGS